MANKIIRLLLLLSILILSARHHPHLPGILTVDGKPASAVDKMSGSSSLLDSFRFYRSKGIDGGQQPSSPLRAFFDAEWDKTFVS